MYAYTKKMWQKKYHRWIRPLPLHVRREPATPSSLSVSPAGDESKYHKIRYLFALEH